MSVAVYVRTKIHILKFGDVPGLNQNGDIPGWRIPWQEQGWIPVIAAVGKQDMENTGGRTNKWDIFYYIAACSILQ